MALEPLIPYVQIPELPLIPADAFGAGVPAAAITVIGPQRRRDPVR